MSRPEWARRDRRPLIQAVSAAVAGAIALAALVVCILLASAGLL